MYWIIVLVAILTVLWVVIKIWFIYRNSRKSQKVIVEQDVTRIQDIDNLTEVKIINDQCDAYTHDKTSDVNQFVLDKKIFGHESLNSNEDYNLYQILESISSFNAKELCYSLPVEQKDAIWNKVLRCSIERENSRNTLLEEAESNKQFVLNEIETVEFETAENDEWFAVAKVENIHITPESLRIYKRKAEELYSRKKKLINELIPAAESRIQAVIKKIEIEQKQEHLFKKNDLERFLIPLNQEQVRVHRKELASNAMERMRLREQQEARSRMIANEQRKKEICSLACSRKIEYLVHFTPVSNLESILKNGLLSRNALVGQRYIFTDEHRADGHLDWISLSISFPNYKMFFAKKNDLMNVDGWAILKIKVEALWELDCKFFMTNAAGSEMQMFGGETTVDAFENMFNFPEHRINIPECFTTDPQAEVMFKDKVSRNYIYGIAFESAAYMKRLGALEGIKVEVNPGLFTGRIDHQHWKNFSLTRPINDTKQSTSF